MTKASKKLTLIVLAVLCIVACVSVLVACNNTPKPTGVEYTVTVLNPDDTAVSGVSVTVKKSGATIGTAVQTDENGKVTFTLAEDDGYTVTLSTLPAHYEVAEGTDLALSKDGLTVKLVEEFHYTVQLTLEASEEPFVAENLFVVICTVEEGGGTGVCRPAVAVGNDGVAKIYAEKGLYKIKVEGLSEDYYYEQDGEGYLRGAQLSEDMPSHAVGVFHVRQDINNVIEVKEQLSQFADQEGKVLAGVDYTAELVYNETDRSYHVGTVDGPQVVVLITEADSERFGLGSALAYWELVSTMAGTYVIDVTPADSPSYVKVTNDYRTFIRGFVNYTATPGKFGETYSIPTEIDTETYYAKYVNSDGVYPLTQELKEFLEAFCGNAQNAETISWQVALDVEPANYWLFPCYYYAEGGSIGPVEGGEIVGEYNLVSFTEWKQLGNEDGSEISNEKVTYKVGDEYEGNAVTNDMFVLVVRQNGTFAVSDANDELNKGTWKLLENGSYEFTEQVFGDTLTYTASFDAKTGIITINLEQEGEEFGVTEFSFQLKK